YHMQLAREPGFRCMLVNGDRAVEPRVRRADRNDLIAVAVDADERRLVLLDHVEMHDETRQVDHAANRIWQRLSLAIDAAILLQGLRHELRYRIVGVQISDVHRGDRAGRMAPNEDVLRIDAKAIGFGSVLHEEANDGLL